MRIMAAGLYASMSSLILLFFFVFIGMIIFASLAFILEHGETDCITGDFYVHGHKTQFISILDGMWWIITTMTTVG